MWPCNINKTETQHSIHSKSGDTVLAYLITSASINTILFLTFIRKINTSHPFLLKGAFSFLLPDFVFDHHECLRFLFVPVGSACMWIHSFLATSILLSSFTTTLKAFNSLILIIIKNSPLSHTHIHTHSHLILLYAYPSYHYSILNLHSGQ